MSNYEVKCGKCRLPIEHICNEDFKQALKQLLTWVPQGAWSSEQMAKAFTKESQVQGDDYNFQDMPFFGSQAWSYLIWHKEDARSFHAVLHNLIRSLGIDPHQLLNELEKEDKP